MDRRQVNVETMAAIHAFKEEFSYFYDEAFDFLECAKDLFIEELGEKEARKICWQSVEQYFSAKNKQ